MGSQPVRRYAAALLMLCALALLKPHRKIKRLARWAEWAHIWFSRLSLRAKLKQTATFYQISTRIGR